MYPLIIILLKLNFPSPFLMITHTYTYLPTYSQVSFIQDIGLVFRTLLITFYKGIILGVKYIIILMFSLSLLKLLCHKMFILKGLSTSIYMLINVCLRHKWCKSLHLVCRYTRQLLILWQCSHITQLIGQSACVILYYAHYIQATEEYHLLLSVVTWTSWLIHL